MGQLSASKAEPEVNRPAADANGQDLVRQFCEDADLIGRLGVTPEELQALSASSLQGSICSRQDVLFMLRTIRRCLAAGSADDKTAVVDSEMAHEIRRGAADRLVESTLSEDAVRLRGRLRLGVRTGVVALAGVVLYRVALAVFRAMPKISPVAVVVFGGEAVLATGLCLYLRHVIAKVRTLLNART